jgi:L-ascorbate metabolism protein UlaG (beta-lactamase superfamily)
MMGAYRITNSAGKVILIDPYLNEKPASPIKVKDLERVDLICVTHLAFDYLGDTVEIAQKFNCPVCCGAETKYWLVGEGLLADNVIGMCWRLQVMAAGIRVRGVKCTDPTSPCLACRYRRRILWPNTACNGYI